MSLISKLNPNKNYSGNSIISILNGNKKIELNKENIISQIDQFGKNAYLSDIFPEGEDTAVIGDWQIKQETSSLVFYYKKKEKWRIRI